MAGQVADAVAGAPAPELRRLVSRYSGIRFEGFAPGTHRGLPSRNLTVVFALDAPLRILAGPERSPGAASFTALAAGLHTGAVVIEHGTRHSAVSLELTPAGARSLLGVPAGELAHSVVSADELLGLDGGELVERLAAAPGWAARFAVLDDVLARRAGRLCDADRSTVSCWRRIVESGGAVRIADLAAELGYSRRQLSQRFRREYGLTPKQVARIVRFERSSSLLRRLGRPRRRRRGGGPALAHVAAVSGYYDQAHMAREWNDLAGCPPSAWLATEELPFVQDGDAGQL